MYVNGGYPQPTNFVVHKIISNCIDEKSEPNVNNMLEKKQCWNKINNNIQTDLI